MLLKLIERVRVRKRQAVNGVRRLPLHQSSPEAATSSPNTGDVMDRIARICSDVFLCCSGDPQAILGNLLAFP